MALTLGLPLEWSLRDAESHQDSPGLQMAHLVRTSVRWGGWEEDEQGRISLCLFPWMTQECRPSDGQWCSVPGAAGMWWGAHPYWHRRSLCHVGWCHQGRWSPLITPWWSYPASSCLQSCAFTLWCLNFTKIFWLQSTGASICTQRIKMYFTAGWQNKEKYVNSELMQCSW